MSSAILLLPPCKRGGNSLALDTATMAYKGLVDQIILISGDSDFVSAAKLARREGIDFILDPMWSDIRPNLSEHVDGIIVGRGRNERPAKARRIRQPFKQEK